jgi:hypothetical protein
MGFHQRLNLLPKFDQDGSCFILRVRKVRGGCHVANLAGASTTQQDGGYLALELTTRFRVPR